MKPISRDHAIYLAGLVDGEGTIAIFKRPKCYEVHVSIANTSPRLDRWLKETTGIGTQGHRAAKANWKESYKWRVPTDDIVAFLEDIKPFLVVKRPQADLMLEYFEKCHVGLGANEEAPVKILALRDVIFDEMQELNKRGR